MKASTGIKLKDRKTLTLGDFKGVDFSSSPLSVHGSRATNMRNFINEYGANKKRNGWKEVCRFAGEPINGIFEYRDDNSKAWIIHAGRSFYRAFDDGTIHNLLEGEYACTYAPAKITRLNIQNQRSQAFLRNGKLYIIGCGDYLVYGLWGNDRYELRRVYNNEDTYIPTTTISIDDDSVEDDMRASLDDVNCLSPKRINQLLGFQEYTLTKDVVFISGKEYYRKTATGYEQYVESDGTSEGWKAGEDIPANSYYHKHTDGSHVWTLDSSIDEGTEVVVRIQTLETVNEEEVATEYLLKNKPLTEGYGRRLYVVEKDGEAVSEKFAGGITFTEGKIQLDGINTKPQIKNRDNIFVTFEHKNEAYARRITDCEFGIQFGVDGNADRLFLSGNCDLPNIDFHSEMDDYTYFSDQSTAALGSDYVPINGYARLSDSTLAVYKEESAQEPTVYYRTGTNKETYDGNGNLLSIKGIFPTLAGNIGEGAVSRYACANLAGDNVMLSKNGLFGIVLGENIATNERYARERSRAINEKLKTHEDLSQAVGIVYQNRYYLAVDGVCYVADSRYKYTSDDSESYNYEWWYWDNIPARVWAKIDNQLYFGCEDGRVCVFDKEYTDRTYETTDEGDFGIDVQEEHNYIVFGNQLAVPNENDILTMGSAGIYAIVDKEVLVKDGRIQCDKPEGVSVKDEIFSFREGIEVYVDSVGNSGLMVDTKYYIREIDVVGCTYILTDEKGKNVINSDCGGFNVYKKLSNKKLYVRNVTVDETNGGGTFQLSEYKGAEPLTLAVYNNTVVENPFARFEHIQNVVAEWYTPILDFGTNEESKTLLKMTVSTSPEVNGRLSFGYETRNVRKLIRAKGINVFSFENFSFENFSFETEFANSYSVRCNERNFNFIIFRFVSDNDSNCAVNTFTVTYKINKSNIGVR